MAIEHDMLGLAQARARVILACEPAQQPELVFEAEAALLLEATAATSLAPRSLFATGSGAYTLLPLARREQLIEQLSRANVVVHNRESEGELWVQMPAGGSTDLLLRAAVEAEAPLLRMTPLFQSRGGEYRAPNVPSP
jgi:hypothetical protein